MNLRPAITFFLLVGAFTLSGMAQTLPKVSLDADSLSPRAIEPLTETNIARDYAIAWKDLSQALAQNRADLLNEQFTGFAHDRWKERIADQQRNGLRTEIVDNGHKLKAIFYSLDGGAMQLQDEAQIQIQVFDGSRLIDTQDASQKYIVLMTPGSDRWYVRSMDPGVKP